MKKLGLFILAVLATMFLLPALAFAQSPTKLCMPTGNGGQSCEVVAPAYPLVTTGITNLNSYAAAVVGQANSSAGDVMCISGSATTTVKVKKVRVSAIASAAVMADVSVALRSTLDSGGTPLTLTTVALDQNNVAGTALVKTFATAPTPGTAIGTVRSQKFAVGTATSTALGPTPVLFDFARYYDQPVVLRGAAQSACVTVSATAGGSWNLDVEWTEE